MATECYSQPLDLAGLVMGYFDSGNDVVYKTRLQPGLPGFGDGVSISP